MSLLYSHRRNWLMRLARERGIDTSSIIKPRASSRPPMPENIDRIDPFI